MRRFFSVLSAVVEKDLRLEWRTRESLLVMVVFALLVLTLFSFAFGPGGGSGENARAVQAGILWISFLFACVIGLSRTMGVERESAGFSAMSTSPALLSQRPAARGFASRGCRRMPCRPSTKPFACAR